MPKHGRFPVKARVEAVVTRRYQVSEQTLYLWRDEFIEEFANALVVLSLEGTPVARNRGAPKRRQSGPGFGSSPLPRRLESLRECLALVAQGGAFKICTRQSYLRSACHPRSR